MPISTKALNKVPLPDQKGLTLKQSRFAFFFVNDANGDATAAVRLAGYSGTDSSISTIARQNAANPKIQKQIQRLIAQRDAVDYLRIMPAREVLSRLSRFAEGDMLDLLNDQGELDLAAAKKSGKGYLLKKLKVRKTIIHQPNYKARRAATGAQYVSPEEQKAKHRFLFVDDSKFQCAGCGSIVEGLEAVNKLSKSEVCPLQGVEEGSSIEYVTYEYEIEDRLSALDKLARHHNVYEKDSEVDWGKKLAELIGPELEAAGFEREIPGSVFSEPLQLGPGRPTAMPSALPQDVITVDSEGEPEPEARLPFEERAPATSEVDSPEPELPDDDTEPIG